MAAKCSQRQDSPWHAAKHLEKASEAAKETQDWTLVVDYLKQASLAYREAGRTQSAAEALSKGARFLEERDPQVRQLCPPQCWPSKRYLLGRDGIRIRMDGGREEGFGTSFNFNEGRWLRGWEWWGVSKWDVGIICHGGGGNDQTTYAGRAERMGHAAMSSSEGIAGVR